MSGDLNKHEDFTRKMTEAHFSTITMVTSVPMITLAIFIVFKMNWCDQFWPMQKSFFLNHYKIFLAWPLSHGALI